MPWTIPNLLLHDKPVPLANMRSLGRTHVFVYCSNPHCHHNAEIDASGLPDDVTFGDLQPRMLCTICDHRGSRRQPIVALWLIGPAQYHGFAQWVGDRETVQRILALTGS
jgi:hypothetical protein